MKDNFFVSVKRNVALSIIWHFRKKSNNNNKMNSLVGSSRNTHFQILAINRYHQEVQLIRNKQFWNKPMKFKIFA